VSWEHNVNASDRPNKHEVGANDDRTRKRPPPGPIAESTPCVHCGYDLRGVDARGVCPECGALVESTLLTPALKSALESTRERTTGLGIGLGMERRPPGHWARVATVLAIVMLAAIIMGVYLAIRR